MAKKAKSKEKRSLVCVTAPLPGRRGNSKICSLLTQKEIKKLWVKFSTKGKFVQEVQHF